MSDIDRYLDAFGDWTPKGVVFDCDGLILDTESVWDGTQQTMLARYGATLTPEQDDSIIGATLEQAAEVIARAAGADYGEVLAAAREQFLTDLGEELHPMPGAIAIVRAAAARVPIACASNSWHEALQDKLTRAGIIDLFANLQSTDTVENGKPAPDMYAKAARELGVAPGECLALEDSAVGARAAVAAGLRLLAVPPHGGDVDEADLRIATLEDEGLLEWIATW
ncbi:HAD-IA family hydrolase [Brachybacterium sp. JHP9]|uniref:HAD-IA family hydrolase n=1 Tax=Brachybacterium equifaecis TaxID=2910770 RepID=A0ABT0QXG0_9MICO|nr:HAD-IA family hydrolase [Brachybacterium equifaecis]MCL6422346.1 HAD-IA family hydrolase [Brachybacterium equifaecis]